MARPRLGMEPTRFTLIIHLDEALNPVGGGGQGWQNGEPVCDFAARNAEPFESLTEYATHLAEDILRIYGMQLRLL